MPYMPPGMPQVPAGRPGVPMPMMTWMPVIKPVEPDSHNHSDHHDGHEPDPPAPARTEPTDPVTAGEKQTAETAAARNGKTAAATAEPSIEAGKAPPPKPLTREEEIGKKVGESVTRFLEKNPEFTDRLERANLDAMLENPDSILNDIKRQFHQSPLFKLFRPFIKRFGKLIAGMFPADVEPAAKQFIEWLFTKPVEGMTGPGLADLGLGAGSGGAGQGLGELAGSELLKQGLVV